MPQQTEAGAEDGANTRALDSQVDTRALNIRVLGPPTLSLGGHPLDLGGKSLALVCYLALEGETRRAVLADLLWTDVPEDAARRNLRRELHRLRATPAGGWLDTQGERLWLRPGYTLDLHEFGRRLRASQPARAARLLRGELLEGLSPPAAEGFAAWRETRAAELVEAELSALAAWAGDLGDQGRGAAAQEVYIRMLRLDPLREQTHRGLMSLLHRLGEQEAALARYRALEHLLLQELGVAPLPQTTELYRQIRDGTVRAAPRLPPGPPEQEPLELPLVGRAQALQTLARNRMVLVTGEAGVGKTRLIREFLGQAPSVLLQGSPETRDLPFAPVAALFAGQPDLLERLHARERAAVGRLLPGLLPMPGLLPGEAPQTAAPETRHTLTLALGEALRTLVGTGVLIVEDLHWLDALTLNVVARLIRDLHGEPAAGAKTEQRTWPGRLVLSTRSAELADRPEIADTLLGLERAGALLRLPLRELDAPEVERLIARLSGQDAPLFSARLYRATAGHPLFLLETLRSLRESGELRTEDGLWQTRHDEHTTDYAEIPIPGSVWVAVLGRVSRLGDAARRLLHAAAVAGEPFGATLHTVCGLGEWEAVELLEQAEQAHLIVQDGEAPHPSGLNGAGLNGIGLDGSGGGSFRFGHDLYRHALLRDMKPARRRLIHRQLGLTLAQAAREGQPHQPARTAMHFEEAGEPALAWPHWQEAAQRSAEVYDHAGAHAQYARALACLPQERPEDLRAAWHLHAASSELLRHLGDQPGRKSALGTMRGLAHRLADLDLRAEVATRLANYHTEQDDYAEAARTAQEALQGLGPHLNAQRQSALMIEAGAALACLEDFAAATEALTPALTLTRGVAPTRYANALYWLGHCAAAQDDWNAALGHYTRSVRELPPERPTRGRVLTLWRLGQVQTRLGEVREAEATFRQADAEARTLHAAPLRALCLSDLGRLLLDSGRTAEAETTLQEAEACCGQDQEGRAAVSSLRARLDAARQAVRTGQPRRAGEDAGA